jgi:hypothetical protein
MKDLDLPAMIISGILDWRVLCTLIVATWVGIPATLCTLAQKDRPAGLSTIGEIANKFGELIATHWVAWLGWGVAMLLLLVGTPFAVLAHRRIENQGTELAALRSKDDPMRISSRDPAQMASYTEQARERYGRKGDTDDQR